MLRRIKCANINRLGNFKILKIHVQIPKWPSGLDVKQSLDVQDTLLSSLISHAEVTGSAAILHSLACQRKNGVNSWLISAELRPELCRYHQTPDKAPLSKPSDAIDMHIIVGWCILIHAPLSKCTTWFELEHRLQRPLAYPVLPILGVRSFS